MNKARTQINSKGYYGYVHPITMKLVCLIGFFAVLSLTSCDSDDDISRDFYIDNLTMDNYPKVDGSTSAEPLQVLIACKLLDVEYSWVHLSWFKYPYRLMPSSDIKPEIGRFITENIYHFGTHSSYLNLIQKNADLILVARTASDEEIHFADSLGINLVEIPIALDAFVFLANINNPVNSLTTKEIQDIYIGSITRWNEVGGTNTEISPYQRNPHSGSQELMESLVMKDLTMLDLPDMIMMGMMGMINQIEYDREGLGYSVNYYTQNMVRSDSINLLAVDGVYPDYNSLKNKEYSYTTDVYVVIREDLDKSSTAYKLFELLLTTSGQSVIEESGYIPYY
jgi:phosphate transport system substrate-binding protein